MAFDDLSSNPWLDLIPGATERKPSTDSAGGGAYAPEGWTAGDSRYESTPSGAFVRKTGIGDAQLGQDAPGKEYDVRTRGTAENPHPVSPSIIEKLREPLPTGAVKKKAALAIRKKLVQGWAKLNKLGLDDYVVIQIQHRRIKGTVKQLLDRFGGSNE